MNGLDLDGIEARANAAIGIATLPATDVLALIAALRAAEQRAALAEVLQAKAEQDLARFTVNANAAMDRMEARVKELETALLLSAAHCQGGHSSAGEAIASAFAIAFPVRMEGLERAALARHLDPRELWPWLYEARAARALDVTGGKHE